MTLTVCLKGKDGMVLASDSRGTFGDPRRVTAQNDNMKKLYAVSKYVGVLLSGSGELGAMIMEGIPEKLKSDNVEGETPVMNYLRKHLMKQYGDWFKGFLIRPVPNSPAPPRPTLSVTAGGYEVDGEGIPTLQKIYSLNCHNNFAPLLHDYGFSLNGVAQYALYLLNRLYTHGSHVENLLALGAYVITETASQDGKVGGPVQMIKILPDRGCVILNSEDMNKILKTNTDRSEKLKVLFFGEKGA
jgi:20S proteasome alpha/beta subunit